MKKRSNPLMRFPTTATTTYLFKLKTIIDMNATSIKRANIRLKQFSPHDIASPEPPLPADLCTLPVTLLLRSLVEVDF